ncbi:FAD-dependent oxidoreductase [Streptomyces sp. NPDC047049]|uniref:FAD-dependent oxidoreductase n=1 Tax=Streptomyces sp. NPDC047049 TaxID=3156688 RepID=UPI0033C269C1
MSNRTDRGPFPGAAFHLPYDRPPLPKQVRAGAWEPSRTQLRSREHLASLEAEFIRAESAVKCDAPALGRDLAAGRRLVVVGEGVLGAEIAASARGMGVEVTLAGLGSVLLGSQAGGRVGGFLTRLHTERGADLCLGGAVEGLAGSGGGVCGVRLASGEVLRAGTVVVAIGARPATEWLAGSGLALGDGVECDAYCRAAPGVYAVGDAASWHHDGLNRRLRLENRTNATEQPRPSRRTSSAPNAPTLRRPTSGPISTTPSSRCTACPPRPPRPTSPKATRPRGASSLCTGRTAR